MARKRTNCACLKCEHKWFSTKLASMRISPNTCPKCHRYDWRVPRMRARRHIEG